MTEKMKRARALLDEARAQLPEMARLREEHHRRHRERVELQQQIQERWQKLFPDL